MKPIICSAFSMLICLISSSALAQNRVLTVDNNPLSVAMFKNITDAYESAQPGDTILLAGSNTGYGSITLKKRLNIVGPGYFLSENKVPGLSANSADLTITFGLNAEGSSAGSTVTGVNLSVLDAQSIAGLVFDRCRLYFNRLILQSQVTIRRCYLAGSVSLEAAGSSIRNSIIAPEQYWISKLAPGTTAANCVFTVLIDAPELSSISSSIFAFSSDMTPAQFAEHVKGSVTHCMAVAPITGGNFLPTGGDNINGMATELVFVGTGANDAKWKLRANSPAIGKGFDGVDMGAFDGPSPYILSGVPSRPRVTRFVVPSLVTSTSGLKFEVDAQSF